MEAEDDQDALPLRPHTIFGVCEAVGEDFGFNAVFLRIPFSAIVLYSPLVAIGAYLALGIVVLASRLLFPARRKPFLSQVDTAALQAANVDGPEFAKAA